MKKLYTYLLAFFIFLYFDSQAQERQLVKAANEMNKYAFATAEEILIPLAKKGEKSPLLYQKLANSYYMMGKLNKAYVWYEKLFQDSKEDIAEDYFRYAHAAKAAGKLEKADSLLAKFVSISQDRRARLIDADAAKNDDFSKEYIISLLPFNTYKSDYAPVFYGKNLVFASARDTGLIAKKIHKE
tara:strand:- start:306 stop:860 length:555 start_codon:yes stop_codon:yes gene_type:complete